MAYYDDLKDDDDEKEVSNPLQTGGDGGSWVVRSNEDTNPVNSEPEQTEVFEEERNEREGEDKPVVETTPLPCPGGAS